jgi:hypothetical protein
MKVEKMPDDTNPVPPRASPPSPGGDFGLSGRIVGLIVCDIWFCFGVAITATVGGALIGSGLDLSDRRAAWIVGIGAAAVGALLGLSMWITGPGRRLGTLQLWAVGSVFLVLVWWFLALGVFVAIQEVLEAATGGWGVTPIGAVIGAIVGLVIGLAAQRLVKWLLLCRPRD